MDVAYKNQSDGMYISTLPRFSHCSHALVQCRSSSPYEKVSVLTSPSGYDETAHVCSAQTRSLNGEGFPCHGARSSIALPFVVLSNILGIPLMYIPLEPTRRFDHRLPQAVDDEVLRLLHSHTLAPGTDPKPNRLCTTIYTAHTDASLRRISRRALQRLQTALANLLFWFVRWRNSRTWIHRRLADLDFLDFGAYGGT
jgi:hypothetical protein